MQAGARSLKRPATARPLGRMHYRDDQDATRQSDLSERLNNRSRTQLCFVDATSITLSPCTTAIALGLKVFKHTRNNRAMTTTMPRLATSFTTPLSSLNANRSSFGPVSGLISRMRSDDQFASGSAPLARDIVFKQANQNSSTQSTIHLQQDWRLYAAALVWTNHTQTVAYQ